MMVFKSGKLVRISSKVVFVFLNILRHDNSVKGQFISYSCKWACCALQAPRNDLNNFKMELQQMKEEKQKKKNPKKTVSHRTHGSR